MKVHNTLEELLEEFYNQNIPKLLRFDNDGKKAAIKFLTSNSLALGKPEPLAKNKQTQEHCEKCGWIKHPVFGVKCMDNDCP